MEKEFLSFNESLSLKQIGFEEPCFAYWGELNGGELFLFMKKNYDTEARYVLAPLYQQVFRWFREKYSLHGMISYKPNIKKWDFIPYDLNLSGKEYVKYYSEYFKNHLDRRYDTVEEAEIELIKELIEIVKNK